MTKNSAEIIAKVAARAADEKKADDIRVLRMPEVVAETEYFVIASALTHVQVRAIVGSITAALEDAGAELLRYEGRGGQNDWVLLDYGDVVVHVFVEENRRYYDLEKLWADAALVSWHE
ncbi:MAG TPA: ribosome silencing factor [Limnochordia bacterium]|nr:ribosome silencing factor [Limnochordia bacterium]